MTQYLHPRDWGARSGAARGGIERRRPIERSLPGTTMPVWLLLVLVGLGLPRTILTDLGVIAPESSWIYYVLALTPFAVWLAVALFRRTATPIRDHLLAGTLYGLSLFVVHAASLSTGRPLGSTLAIAMMIGVGVGVIAGVAGATAQWVRRIRRAGAGERSHGGSVIR